MKTKSVFILTGVAFILFISLWYCTPPSGQHEPVSIKDPLPSWNEGSSKQAIMDFVAATTDPESNVFIPENQRIVVFDNDGTLWSEQPYYFQLHFAIDRIKTLAPQHPEWATEQPFKAILENDMHTVMSYGVSGLTQLVMASHAGMNTEEFNTIVRNWIKTARHPETGKLLKEMVYQPMLEVLDYLRTNGFKTFIVSGGGIDFMRPWTEEVYGIPPEQVVGSSVKLKYEVVDGKPVIKRLAEIAFINDKEGKPVGIETHIGRRPVAAFGNSDGDLQMLQWTAAGEGKRLIVYIHHTDDEREWAYDRESHIGKLDKGLEKANEKGWLLVNMKNDWNQIYPH
jgi:phosphoserine phosphatase